MKKNGITLIGIMIVIVILGIVAAVIVPFYRGKKGIYVEKETIENVRKCYELENGLDFDFVPFSLYCMPVTSFEWFDNLKFRFSVDHDNLLCLDAIGYRSGMSEPSFTIRFDIPENTGEDDYVKLNFTGRCINKSCADELTKRKEEIWEMARINLKGIYPYLPAYVDFSEKLQMTERKQYQLMRDVDKYISNLLLLHGRNLSDDIACSLPIGESIFAIYYENHHAYLKKIICQKGEFDLSDRATRERRKKRMEWNPMKGDTIEELLPLLETIQQAEIDIDNRLVLLTKQIGQKRPDLEAAVKARKENDVKWLINEVKTGVIMQPELPPSPPTFN